MDFRLKSFWDNPTQKTENKKRLPLFFETASCLKAEFLKKLPDLFPLMFFNFFNAIG